MHYISSDGYDMYVGKNNLQNEELTSTLPLEILVVPCQRNPWLSRHCKDKRRRIAGPYLEEAGKLAAYYSKNRGSEKIEIDYIEKNMSKKPKEENLDLSYIIPTTH